MKDTMNIEKKIKDRTASMRFFKKLVRIVFNKHMSYYDLTIGIKEAKAVADNLETIAINKTIERFAPYWEDRFKEGLV